MSLKRCVHAVVLTAFACLPLIGYAKHKPEMLNAKVISQNIQSHQVDRGAMTGTPLVRFSNTVIVETETQRMTWIEVSSYATGTRTQDVVNAIPLPVNGTIQFYKDGNWYIVLDDNKKKHKFSLVHLEIIQ